MDKSIQAKDLKPGNYFKYTPRQRKWRVVWKIESVQDRGDGNVLVILPDCRQLLFKPDRDITIFT